MRFLLAVITMILGVCYPFLVLFTDLFHDAEFMQNLRRPLEYIEALLMLYLGPVLVGLGIWGRAKENAQSIWQSTWPVSIIVGLVGILRSLYTLTHWHDLALGIE